MQIWQGRGGAGDQKLPTATAHGGARHSHRSRQQAGLPAPPGDSGISLRSTLTAATAVPTSGGRDPRGTQRVSAPRPARIRSGPSWGPAGCEGPTWGGPGLGFRFYGPFPFIFKSEKHPCMPNLAGKFFPHLQDGGMQPSAGSCESRRAFPRDAGQPLASPAPQTVIAQESSPPPPRWPWQELRPLMKTSRGWCVNTAAQENRK